MTETTHFGYRTVSSEQKTALVHTVFESVADRYDLMNDLMSLGWHRLWKKYFMMRVNARPGQQWLDVATGTGDIALALAKQVGKTGCVFLTDINRAMLTQAIDRVIDAGYFGCAQAIEADAEALPFPDHTFDGITIAFRLRNVTNHLAALRAMYRVLKAGGRLLILEFSQPSLPILKKLYDAYSFHVIPRLGEWVLKDRHSYEYLVESIRMHPDSETLQHRMEEVGYETVDYTHLSQGIVALHQGWKY